MNVIGLISFIQREMDRTLRVAIQTLITPWISALLYIFIFGFVVGKRIDLIAGVTYIEFVLPGILMMNVIAAAFTHSSSSLYLARFLRSIEEILVAPFSYSEMIAGYVVSAVFRAIIVGLGVFVIAMFFGAASMEHFGLFLLYMIAVAIIFAFVGLLVGLWANSFEQLNVLNTFVIMPFSFLGGIFYSIHMLPATMQAFVRANPFFYFIDGIRYSMIGIRESNAAVGYALILFLIVALGLFVGVLFKRGWHLKG